jgi:hypothetical protein
MSPLRFEWLPGHIDASPNSLVLAGHGDQMLGIHRHCRLPLLRRPENNKIVDLMVRTVLVRGKHY